MKVPTVTFCCCGCSLRTGTIIIGVLGLIASVIYTIIIGMGIVAVEYIVDHPEVHTPAADRIRANETVLMVLFIPTIIYCVICAIISVVLLIGIKQNKLRYVRFWVIVSLVLFVFQLSLAVFEHSVNPKSPDYFIRIGFSSLVQLYYIMVVYSFYKEQMANSKNGTV